MNSEALNNFKMNREEKIKRTKQVAIIAGVFTALVSLLLLLNYLQIKSSDPLESQTLKTLVDRLSADPGNHALMEEIRQLDLLARKAYFNSLWQIRTGAYLLLFGAIVLVLALRVHSKLVFSIGKPSDEKPTAGRDRKLSQRWIAATGAIIIIGAGMSAVFTADYLRPFDTLKMAEEVPGHDGIEQIDISLAEPTANSPEPEMTTGGPPAGTADAGMDADPQTQEMVTEEASVETPGETTARQPPPPLLTEASVRQNHNTFRGPWGTGISAHGNIPSEWDAASGENIIWKTEIPMHGYNSPVLWDDKLFMSGATESRRMVYCYDRHTGSKQWEKEASGIPGSPATPPRTTDDTGLAAPSLVVDGQRVVALFGTGDIIAFDHNGNRLWAKNLGVPANHYGHSSSLLMWDGKVMVQYDTQDGSRVFALEAATGQIAWETPRSNGVSWASPILAKVDGTFQLILLANPSLSAYDIQSGRQLWSVNCMSGEVGPSPAFGGGLVYAANEYAKMVGVDAKTGQQQWEDNYYLPEVASLLYFDGLLYVATTFAVLACFEASSGEFLWEYDTDDGFYSSPVIADNKLYIIDTSGKAYVFNPGREPDLIATSELGERVFATPVFAEGRLYIRGNRHLYCIGN